MTPITQTASHNSVQKSKNDIALNPKSILGKDDFLKLLLTELSYQDPTSPMDTEKILTQTSQLAALETQKNTNKVMTELADRFKMEQSLSAIAAIGRKAKLSNEIEAKPNQKNSFDLYFEQEVKSGEITIKDTDGNVVKTIRLDPKPAGLQSFEWDGTDDKGEAIAKGKYSIEASYVGTDNKHHDVPYGTYKIESVRFEENKAYLKLGNHYVPFDQVKEIFA